MKPVSQVQEAVQLIKSFDGPAQAFRLALQDSLLDPVGVNMAVITDHILARGWQPDGFEQHAGFRIYRYMVLE